MPKLSIVVTSYNIESYIGQCLDSIVDQTLKDIEIIVVDDGSTDNTQNIIQGYVEKDSRVTLIALAENTIGGVATAANAGLEKCTGDYIGFADGDDVYELNMFETLWREASNANSDLAMCKYLLLDEETGKTKPPAEERRWEGLNETTRFDLDKSTKERFLQFIAVPWRKIYRRELIEVNEIRFPVGDYFYEDNPFHWFSILSAESIVVIPEVLCFHRVARIGQSMAVADDRLLKMFEHHGTIRNWLIQEGIEEEFRVPLLGWITSQLEWISRAMPAELQDNLFETAVSEYANYSQADIDRMIIDFSKGERARRLTEALLTNSKADFFAVDKKTAAKASNGGRSLFEEGLFRLKTEGVLSTSKLTARYLKSRYLPKSKSLTNTRDNEVVDNTQIYFAITVLQARIAELEKKIDDLKK